MKVLIISHNVFSHTGNMGKTLLRYFHAFSPDEVAEFYIHSEVPTDGTVCRNYFRFTDRDALKSLLPVKKYGSVLGPESIQEGRATSRTDTGFINKVYRLGEKRTGSIYFARNLLWLCSHWFTDSLKEWLRAFDPDIIFFAAADYSFMFNIARRIAAYLGKPLVVSCMDDYFLYNLNHRSPIGWLEHAASMKIVHKTMRSACSLITICEPMADAYRKLFGLPTYVIHTPAVNPELEPDVCPSQISYIGNLSCGRHQSLLEIGKALLAQGRTQEPVLLDVYSAEKNPAILADMVPENGIRFHGQIPADEVLRVMQRSIAVIHTESFNPSLMQRVRFSVSTKIAESLMYGPCLLAYGPTGIASMDYLEENQAACIVHSEDQLGPSLQRILTDPAFRQQILVKARALAQKNHDIHRAPEEIRRILQKYAD